MDSMDFMSKGDEDDYTELYFLACPLLVQSMIKSSQDNKSPYIILSTVRNEADLYTDKDAKKVDIKIDPLNMSLVLNINDAGRATAQPFITSHDFVTFLKDVEHAIILLVVYNTDILNHESTKRIWIMNATSPPLKFKCDCK